MSSFANNSGYRFCLIWLFIINMQTPPMNSISPVLTYKVGARGLTKTWWAVWLESAGGVLQLQSFPEHCPRPSCIIEDCGRSTSICKTKLLAGFLSIPPQKSRLSTLCAMCAGYVYSRGGFTNLKSKIPGPSPHSEHKSFNPASFLNSSLILQKCDTNFS